MCVCRLVVSILVPFYMFGCLPCGCTGEGASCTFQVFSYDADDAPIVDIYTNQAAQYQGHYLLFPSIYLHYPNPPAWPCGNDGLWFSRLVHSAPSDGARFSYVGGDREAWLSSGEAGQAPPAECASSPEGSAWDSAMVGASARASSVSSQRVPLLHSYS